MKKTLLAVAVLLLALAAGALFWLRGNLDGLIEAAIETQGGAMTQAKVSVDRVEIRPADGTGAIRGLTIGNPQGFATAHALKVAEIEVAIDLASVTGDVVTIRRIAIKAPDIIYEQGETMTNFDALQKNIAARLGPGGSKKSGGKKLIVEEFTLRGAKAQASAAFMQGQTAAVPLPDIVLRDIGKARGGVTPEELGAEIARILKTRLAAGVSFDALAKGAGGVLDKTGATLKGLFK